jgi:hypothetical protein
MTPSGRPGPDEIWVTCDLIKATDSPIARLQTTASDGQKRAFGQVELTAEGGVVIEGDHPKHGAFTLQGHQATFDQAKGMFLLRGNDSAPATVTLEQFPGAPRQPQTAQKWFYFLHTGEARVEGTNQFQLHQFDQP